MVRYTEVWSSEIFEAQKKKETQTLNHAQSEDKTLSFLQRTDVCSSLDFQNQCWVECHARQHMYTKHANSTHFIGSVVNPQALERCSVISTYIAWAACIAYNQYSIIERKREGM